MCAVTSGSLAELNVLLTVTSGRLAELIVLLTVTSESLAELGALSILSRPLDDCDVRVLPSNSMRLTKYDVIESGCLVDCNVFRSVTSAASLAEHLDAFDSAALVIRALKGLLSVRSCHASFQSSDTTQ